ncbi:LuxR C-terminal-related transcriptional regulator [Nonomuraea sp. NPDC005650]|uniref:LuxR C-terminal-related transcriptional regulator n=1 Tax=Nonomuraea sp. NPDC005650 TaxID=3157045 RepID=UPI0033AC6465
MSPALSGLGMPEGAEAIYLSLLERHTAATADLAAETGRTAEEVSGLLAWLRGRGLVLRANGLAVSGGADVWAAADPAHALHELVRRREDELHRIRGVLPDLRERFHRSRQDDEAGGALESLDGWEDIGNRYHQLLAEARQEVLMWDHAPYVVGANAPKEHSALDRGVRFHVLCDPRDLPAELGEEFAVLRGLQARLHPDLPFRGAIADRRLCVITMDRESQNARALLVRPSPLLDGLIMLFDTCWSRAVPMTGRPGGLDEPEREVLTLLAAGLKDEAIARQLDITTRTVRRRVQAVLVALNAKSRFHAGVEAIRRGWV